MTSIKSILVLTWFQVEHDVVVGEDGRDGKDSSGQSFAQDQDVRLHAVVIASKHFSWKKTSFINKGQTCKIPSL